VCWLLICGRRLRFKEKRWIDNLKFHKRRTRVKRQQVNTGIGKPWKRSQQLTAIAQLLCHRNVYVVRLVLRQPIYEKDRINPVDARAALTLDPILLQMFPEGYRHLAYLQSSIGYKVKSDMPGLKGTAVEALYARGRGWLAGQVLE
jgi:hypothetical protein